MPQEKFRDFLYQVQSNKKTQINDCNFKKTHLFLKKLIYVAQSKFILRNEETNEQGQWMRNVSLRSKLKYFYSLLAPGAILTL